MKILLIEPDQALNTTLKLALEAQECRVFPCDGSLRRLLFSLRHAPYDCVLFNFQQSTFSGSSLLKWLKSHLNESGIVAYSTFPTDEAIALDEGATIFLGQPFTLRELCRAIGAAKYSLPQFSPVLARDAGKNQEVRLASV